MMQESNTSHSSRVVASVVNGHTFTVSDRYDFNQSKILGRGTYGVVATALDTVNNRTIAIKRIRPFANDDWDARHTLREIRLLRVLGPHPNIISLYNLSANEEKAELYMMMELMDCDLHRVIQSKQVLTPKHIKCFLKQILEGIRAMHDVGVFHRDLKPGNILVSKDCQVRITDFGLARFMDESTRQGTNKLNPMTEYVVTRWYRAPELLLSPGGVYDEAIDLWSIGCIFAELIRRRPLFPGKSHAHQVQLVFELLGYDPENLGFSVTVEAARYLDKRSMSFTSNATTLRQAVGQDAPDDAIDLLEKLLTVNPVYRCSASNALQSAFLKGADLLCDYGKNYLRRPSLDDFDFEQEKYSLDELKGMILDEIRYYYRRPSGSSHSRPNSGPTSRVGHPLASMGLDNEEAYYRGSSGAGSGRDAAGSREGAGSRDGTLSRDGTIGRGPSHPYSANSSYMDEGPSSQLQTTRMGKRSMETMESGDIPMSNPNSNSSMSKSFRGMAVGNIIASARSMNASSPTPRTATTPSKQQVLVTMHKESKARYRSQSNSGPSMEAAARPVRVPPLIPPQGAKSLADSLTTTSVFSNIQAYQSLSARQPPTDPSNSNNMGTDRKVFTAPSFHFPTAFTTSSEAQSMTGNTGFGSYGPGMVSSTASTAHGSMNNSVNPSPRGSFSDSLMNGYPNANLSSSGYTMTNMNGMEDVRMSMESKSGRPSNPWRSNGSSTGRASKR